LSKNKHLCTNCQKLIPDLNKVLYVDQSRMLGFCSESCIVGFHGPLMENFENEELARREELNLPYTEFYKSLYQNKELLDKALYYPNKVYEYKNNVGTKFYTHFYEFEEDGNQLFYLLISSYFNNTPAFIYFKLITEHRELAESYIEGTEINKEDLVEDLMGVEEEVTHEISLPEDVVEDIEMKKSEYLAKLLETRSEEDVPFENFPEYDEYLPMVLDEPDEIYSQTDESGDDVKVFIKSFKIKKQTFFYIAICIEVALPELEEQKALLPVLGFPSHDANLYKEYAYGEKLNQMTKN
jgi:hypothetical protein